MQLHQSLSYLDILTSKHLRYALIYIYLKKTLRYIYLTGPIARNVMLRCS